MKNEKYHTVGIVPKSNTKIVDSGKINTPNTHISPFNFLAWHRQFTNNKKTAGLSELHSPNSPHFMK
jgi:hypothetical protein